MYYMRLEEAKKLADMGEEDDDRIKFSEYLSDNVTMWRFPFPDEDEMIASEFVNAVYDKGFNLPVGDVEVNHAEICVHNTHKGGGYGVNIFLPCPNSKEATYRMSNNGAGEQFLRVRFQAIRNGEEKTIFECARCGQLQRFSDEDVAKIKERAMEYYEVYKKKGESKADEADRGIYEYAVKVIERFK